MAIAFNPLWKLLSGRDMSRADLRHRTGLSPATVAKLCKDGNIITDVLARIGEAPNCDIADLCQITEKGCPRDV